VQRSVKDDLLERVVRRAREIQPGDPLDPASRMGPLVGEEHAARVQQYVELGRREARAVLDGGEVPGAPTRAYVAPSIFDEVAPESRLAREEVFGPVLAAFEFETEDEAIALANDSIYGLAASVWSDSLTRAHRTAHRLRAGTVSVNCVDALDVTTPFGGFGQSGQGRDLSLHALQNYTALKTTWVHLG
jgi:4-(gamma-glutamylamino)butanal dehydrogenase